jgi:hypothetical protein
VPLELERVTVHPFPGARERRAYPFHPVFEPASPAFQDPQPDVGPGLAKEREVHAELVVFPGRRAGLGQQILQPLLPFSGQPVDDLGPARAARTGRGARSRGRLRVVVFPGDQAIGVQLVQAGVEGSVGQRPERAEQHVQLFAQLVAVHGPAVQQP